MANYNYNWRSDRLKDLMSRSGISLTALAESSGVSVSALQSYSQERSVPSLESWIKLSDFFSVPVDYFLDRWDSDEINRSYSEIFMQLRRAPYEAYLSGGRKELRLTTGNTEAPWPYNLLDDVIERTGKKWETTLNSDQENGLDNAIKLLGEREERILRQYYETGKTLDEVAATENVSRERVRQIVSKSVHRLRHPVLFRLIELGAEGAEMSKSLTKAAEELRAKLQDVNNMEIELRGKMAQMASLVSLVPQEAMENAKDNKDWSSVSIDELDLTVRSWNCLRRAGIKTIAQACQAVKEERLLKLRNLGRKSLDEILTKLELCTGENFSVERRDWRI